MSIRIINSTIITLLVSSALLAVKLDVDFGDKQVDNVLTDHFRYFTRYAHSFDKNLEDGECGELFETAVSQYEKHLMGLPEFLEVDHMLESFNFDASKCKHVSGGYTWVLLQVQEDRTICRVHVPLDLKNYDKDSEEVYPLLNFQYAMDAVKEQDTGCVYLNSAGVERKQYKMVPKISEAQQEDDNNAPARKHEDSNEDDWEDMSDKEQEQNSNQQNIDLDEDESTHSSTHQNHKSASKSMAACTDEDKKRILELYAAEITRSQAPGFVIYTQNIFNCKASHDSTHTYSAEFRLNGHVCEFHVVNDTMNADLTFLEHQESDVISCKEFKGFA